MRLNFHGQLRQLYGDSVVIEARDIRDAVEGFSRQAEDWPRDMPVVIPGYTHEGALEECPEEIDLMPSFHGGSGKTFNIIVGAALIVTGIALGGFTNPLGASLIISGAVMALQGIVMLFMKAPTFKKNEDPEASKYVSVNRNTTAVGTPVTIAYGTIELAGHWLSLQSDSNNLSHGVFPTSPT